MKFYTKVKWVLGILMVFFLILGTNLLDRHNFIRVRDSVVSIYEDRLIAKGLIFELSRAIQEKEVALISSDTSFFKERNEKINSDIDSYITQFETTKLTAREKTILRELKADLQKLKIVEEQFASTDYKRKNALLRTIDETQDDLYELSKIQLAEGERQMAISKQAVDTVELFTHIEIYVLVILAIIIQIVVIYRPKEE